MNHLLGEVILMTTIQELYMEYVKELDSRKGTGYFIGEMKPTTKIAVNMFNAIKRGGKSDWLKHNQALKEACKRVGITSSPQLRDLIKASEGETHVS